MFVVLYVHKYVDHVYSDVQSASHGSVEAPLLFAFNGRAFPFIVILERGSEDIENSFVKGVKVVLSVLKGP